MTERLSGGFLLPVLMVMPQSATALLIAFSGVPRHEQRFGLLPTCHVVRVGWRHVASLTNDSLSFVMQDKINTKDPSAERC